MTHQLKVAFYVSCLLVAGTVSATVPNFIPVQGVLTNPSSGEAIAGPVDITFALYPSEGADATAMLWSETYDATTHQVLLDEGFFTVYLGEVTAIDLVTLVDAPALWLGITVGADAEMPRVPLVAVPFAIEAQVCREFGALDETDAAYLAGLIDTPCLEGQYFRGFNTDGSLLCAVAATGTVTDVSGATGISISGTANSPVVGVDFTAVSAAAHNHDGDYQPMLNGTACGTGEYVADINPVTGAFSCDLPPDNNTNAATLCGSGRFLDGDGNCVLAEGGLTSDGASLTVDYSAVAAAAHSHDGDYQPLLNGTACGTGEYVADIDPVTGAFSCDLPPDNNTNAATICSGAQYLTGDGACVTDATLTDTDVTDIMSASGLSRERIHTMGPVDFTIGATAYASTASSLGCSSVSFPSHNCALGTAATAHFAIPTHIPGGTTITEFGCQGIAPDSDEITITLYNGPDPIDSASLTAASASTEFSVSGLTEHISGTNGRGIALVVEMINDATASTMYLYRCWVTYTDPIFN